MRTLLAFGLLALFALCSGCVGDSGGSASVSFDGTGNGTHDDKTKCDKDATIFSNGQVDAGQVDVRVTDGEGREVFHQQFDGGANMDSHGLAGSSGTWDISATRTSDTLLGSPFSGHYTFNLAC